MQQPIILEATRLRLLPAGEAWLQVLLAGPSAFAFTAGYPVAEGYCEFPGAVGYSLDSLRRSHPLDRAWWAPFLFLDRASRTVIGLGGFKGPPLERAVEIGYSVAPAYRGRGLATEAVEVMVKRAFSDQRVERVLAHTLPEASASTRVLTKCGFTRAGEWADPEAGIVWRWEKKRG